MAEATQLEEIKETELLEALSNISSQSKPTSLNSTDTTTLSKQTDFASTQTQESKDISLTSTNLEDLTSVLKQLLKEKTIQVTIKIKD
jgi:hypothetical protein